MRFFYKITAVYIFFIMMMSFGQMLLFEQYFLGNIEENLLRINKRGAENIADQVESYTHKIEKSLQVIAAEQDIQDNQELLDTVNNLLPEVDVLVLTNEKGDIIRLSGNTKKPAVLNLTGKQYYEEARKGNTWVTDVFTSVSGKKVIAVSIPVKKDGVVRGVLIAYVDLYANAIASMFDNKSFGEKGTIALIDAKGDIVYSNLRDRIGKKSLLMENLTELAGMAVLDDFSGAQQHVGYKKTPNQWTVIVSTPAQNLQNTRNLLLGEMIITTLAGSILFLLIGIFAVRKSTKPFKELLEAFKGLKAGRYTALDDKRLPKEFSEMVQIYNESVRLLKSQHKDLEVQANTDILTGAGNRRAFEDKLETLQCSAAVFSVLLMDLDHFKELNDREGHAAGDQVLQNFVRLFHDFAEENAFFRIGGDEFVLFLLHDDTDEIASLAENIRRKAEQCLRGCTMSMGIACFPADHETPEEIVALADQALYMSKKSRNAVRFYKDIH